MRETTCVRKDEYRQVQTTQEICYNKSAADEGGGGGGGEETRGVGGVSSLSSVSSTIADAPAPAPAAAGTGLERVGTATLRLTGCERGAAAAAGDAVFFFFAGVLEED